MITVEMQELFDDLKRELVAIRTDIIVMKYSLEQIEEKLDKLKNQPAVDPFAGRTMHTL